MYIRIEESGRTRLAQVDHHRGAQSGSIDRLGAPPPWGDCFERHMIDGTAVATAMLGDAARRAGGVTASLGRKPCPATVLVGDDPASRTYVKMKANRCHSIGIDSRRHHLADDASTDEVLELVSRLSRDDAVDGILVQHPTPPHVDERLVFEAIAPAKDVEGAAGRQ
jgi:methylenetetrahydrofolate dehydrogenase (NADP+) / methenyltetrahydrofolate cyclohydrolase